MYIFDSCICDSEIRMDFWGFEGGGGKSAAFI